MKQIRLALQVSPAEGTLAHVYAHWVLRFGQRKPLGRDLASIPLTDLRRFRLHLRRQPPTPEVDMAARRIEQVLRHTNPHARFFDSRQRGYVAVDLTRERMETRFQAISDRRDPKATVSTLKRFVVESGKAGAVEL